MGVRFSFRRSGRQLSKGNVPNGLSSRHLEVPRLGGRCSLSRPVRLLFTLVVTCDSPVKLGISSYADWPGGEPPVKGLFHPMVVCLFPTDVSVLSIHPGQVRTYT